MGAGEGGGGLWASVLALHKMSEEQKCFWGRKVAQPEESGNTP